MPNSKSTRRHSRSNDAIEKLVQAQLAFFHYFSVAVASDPTAACQILSAHLKHLSVVNGNAAIGAGAHPDMARGAARPKVNRNFAIRRFLEQRPDGANIDEVIDHLERDGMAEGRASLTTRLNRLAKQGYIAKKRRGQFTKPVDSSSQH
jgi:hypothetical protein